MGNQKSGNCMNIHMIMYKWKGQKQINLKAGDDQFEQKDFVLNENGNLFINQINNTY